MINRNYKDGVFRSVFNDTKPLKELYFALTGNLVNEETKIEIVTLDGAIYGDLKNDLAFVVDNELILLLEHQSTINPNMPLRMMAYLGREYTKIVKEKIYRSTPIPIPTPKLFVFYNGKETMPETTTLRLSDLYIKKLEDIDVEVKVKVFNINYQAGRTLLSKCKLLKEYSLFMETIRINLHEGLGKEASIGAAIKTCLKENIMVEFIKEHGKEGIAMLFDELTIDEMLEIREEDGFESGIKKGLESGIKKGRAEGRAEGISEGRAEGISEGRTEGISEGRTEIIQKLIANGMEPKQISQITGIKEEEIKEILK